MTHDQRNEKLLPASLRLQRHAELALMRQRDQYRTLRAALPEAPLRDVLAVFSAAAGHRVLYDYYFFELNADRIDRWQHIGSERPADFPPPSLRRIVEDSFRRLFSPNTYERFSRSPHTTLQEDAYRAHATLTEQRALFQALHLQHGNELRYGAYIRILDK